MQLALLLLALPLLLQLELRRLELLLLALPLLLQLELQPSVGKQPTEPATWQPGCQAVALMQQLELLSARRRLDLRNTVARQWLRKVLLARRRLVG